MGSLFFAFFALFYLLKIEGSETKTPIKHLVVIFQENRSFDHYFGTYPFAENKKGEPKFKAKKETQQINGLAKPLLKNNQNEVNPFRLPPSVVAYPSPLHHYINLQEAAHAGLMDQFVQQLGVPPNKNLPMAYYDGNTVTALWNYAQRFSMSDNFHSTMMGPSTIGAINLISGQTHGAHPSPLNKEGEVVVIDNTVINDVDPEFDKCSMPPTISLSGINVGDLLNKKKVTWGWFQGGFADCSKTHKGPLGPVVDYVAHHNPFQYYKATSNPKHLSPSSTKMIGKTDQANHLYDIKDFYKVIEKGNIPSVSFLKAPAFQNEHAGNSTPLLAQEFFVSIINKLQKTDAWKHMAIIICYDDSGGFYDHEMPPIINDSQTPEDALVRPGNAGDNPPLGGYQGRLGYGQRLPFILISPWARKNFVDSTLIDQTSVLRFIEDNWKLGRIGDFSLDKFASSIEQMFDFEHKPDLKQLILSPKTGEVVNH